MLGLAGQDWTLLPWMLDPGLADGEVLPGSCHIRCLRELGVARLWAEAVQEYYRRRWPLWRTGLTGGVRWRLHCSPQAGHFYLWRADGRLSSFPMAALRGLMVSALGEVGSGQASVLLNAMGTADSGVPVQLTDVVASLGLTDRYPAVEGTLTRRLKNLGTPDMVDILEARYFLPLDGPTIRAARELSVVGSWHGRE